MKHVLLLMLDDRKHSDPRKRCIHSDITIDSAEIAVLMRGKDAPILPNPIDAMAAAVMRLVAARFNEALADAYRMASGARLNGVRHALMRDDAGTFTSVPIETVPPLDPVTCDCHTKTPSWPSCRTEQHVPGCRFYVPPAVPSAPPQPK